MWTITINPDSIIKKGDEEKIMKFLNEQKYSMDDKLVIASALANGFVFAENIVYSDKQLPVTELVLIKHTTITEDK